MMHTPILLNSASVGDRRKASRERRGRLGPNGGLRSRLPESHVGTQPERTFTLVLTLCALVVERFEM